ncbi:hypothetical protein KI440_01530 [Candidatus Saccharibacteria bacterium TM7i]|nr:hypothetical protein KI440_01530 [Candidatus Saccharibacteria bacterium TM7i]
MGLYLKQNETRSELRQRIEKELQEKARKRSEDTVDLPDGVEDSAYVKDTKSTTGLAWVWLGIFIAVIALIIWLLVSTL